MAVEPSADMMDQDACAEIRALLTRHGVPVAAFIDDHVANAIAQRNILASALLETRTAIRHDKVALIDEALKKAYPSGTELNALGDAVARHMQDLWKSPPST
jgi:hypothetical protein